MKTILLTLTAVASLFAVSCSCYGGGAKPAACDKAQKCPSSTSYDTAAPAAISFYK